jgi:alpha-D-ribose 1-methylphosphonate 5-triphosphate diphosphatase
MSVRVSIVAIAKHQMQEVTMTDELILKNAKIVTPSEVVEGSVRTCNGVIDAIHSGASSAASALDLEGDYLIPGLIDIHTDNLERHIMPRTTAEWPVMAALVGHDAQVAAAGITTVLDALCVGTMGHGVRSFEKVQETIAMTDVGKRNRMFRSEHLLHLRVELTNEKTPAMFAQLHEHPDLVLVSLMDHTPGQRQWADLEKYIAMERRDYKLSEEEISESLRKFKENQQKYSQPNRRELLSMMSGRSILLASHDDTTLEHVEEAYADGIAISEFPTTALAARAAHERGMHIVAGSPNLVLGRSHSGNVAVAELASLGLVDVLSSDYVPSSLLYGAFLLSANQDIPLHEALKTVTLHPAQLVGLNDRGSIALGKRADLVRVRQVENIPLPLMIWRQGERVG